MAEPMKNTGWVLTLDAANREPTRQTASRESEEARGAGKWEWPPRWGAGGLGMRSGFGRAS